MKKRLIPLLIAFLIAAAVLAGSRILRADGSAETRLPEVSLPPPPNEAEPGS